MGRFSPFFKETSLSRNNTLAVGNHLKGCVILHGTAIVRWDEMTVWLDDGGWPTATTHSRMNHVLRILGIDAGVFQRNHDTYITVHGRTSARSSKDYFQRNSDPLLAIAEAEMRRRGIDPTPAPANQTS